MVTDLGGRDQVHWFVLQRRRLPGRLRSARQRYAAVCWPPSQRSSTAAAQPADEGHAEALEWSARARPVAATVRSRPGLLRRRRHNSGVVLRGDCHRQRTAALPMYSASASRIRMDTNISCT